MDKYLCAPWQSYAQPTLFCQSLSFRERLAPFGFWRVPNPEFSFHLLNVLVPSLFPINGNQTASCSAALECPRNVLCEESRTFPFIETERSENGCYGRHWETQIGELEKLECKLRLDVDRQIANAVVKVMTFPISLLHVRKLRIVNVVYLYIVQ
jgi:hypothetical protein